MKAALLPLLACPHCGREVTWTPFAKMPRDSQEQEGFLECPRNHCFPVIQGIPRFLNSSLFPALQRRYPHYFTGTDASLWRRTEEADRSVESHKVLFKTIERFGHEWTRYGEYNAENFGRFLKPVKSQLAPGMVVLDAGCGAGRHLVTMADAGLDVVGVDVSWAVETAYSRTRENPRVHVVQADLYHLPFRRSAFHFAYSLGVLHHLPDPSRGVAAIVPHIRPGGFLLAWVYMRTTRKLMLEPLRRAVQVLPAGAISGVSLLLAALEYGLLIGPYTWLSGAFGRSVLLRFVPLRIREYAELGFQVSRVDWYDRLAAPVSKPMTMGQAETLLALPELCDQVVTPIDDSWWQCYARVHRAGNKASMI